MSTKSAEPTGRKARALAAAPALLFVVYVALGQRLGDAYPVSSFSMYARQARTHTSRLVAIDAEGRARDVRDLDAWRCDRAIDVRPDRCVTPVDFDATTYLDDLDAAWVESHADDPSEPRGELRVDLSRRVFAIDPAGGPLRSVDCLIARCTVARTEE